MDTGALPVPSYPFPEPGGIASGDDFPGFKVPSDGSAWGQCLAWQVCECREGRQTQTCWFSTPLGHHLLRSQCPWLHSGWFGRVGVTRQCWDWTSPGESLSRWLWVQEGFSESEREVSALHPHPSASVLPRQRLLRLLSWLFPPASPEPRACAPLSPLLVLSLQRCWDVSPSCAGGAVPILILPLGLPGLPRAGPRPAMCRVNRGGFGTLCRGGVLPGHAGPGLLVIFSNRCY